MIYRWLNAHERSSVNAVCFVASTNFLLTGGGNDAIVRLHNVDRGGSSVLFPREHVGSVNALDCSQTGGSFVSAGGDLVVVWDVVKHQKLQKLKANGKDEISACKYLSTDLVASCGSNRELRIHDLRQEQRVRPVFTTVIGEDNLTSIDYLSSNITLGSADGSLYTVDLRNQTLTSDRVVDGCVLSVETHDDGCLVTAEDGSVRLWNLEQAKCTYKLQLMLKLQYKVTSTLVPDLYNSTKHIFSGSETGTLYHTKMGNLKSEELQIDCGTHSKSKVISIVKYSPYKNVLAASGGDGRLHIWENIL